MSDTNKAPHVDMLRSPLGRARGLGAAHAGSHHWRVQRLTGVALVPLTVWFVFSVIGHLGASQADMSTWMSAPITMVLMVAMIVATFHHLQLGLQTVIEDYVHEDGARLAAMLAMKAACVLLALACIISVLRLGL
jgi:succinate dehydrogenase / fumarate reductase, membrane anchor subunit